MSFSFRCDVALFDAALPDDEEFRLVLHDYMITATNEVELLSPPGSTVPENISFARWSWDGAQS